MSEKNALLGELAAAEGAVRGRNRAQAGFNLEMAKSRLKSVRLSRAERKQINQRIAKIAQFVSRR